MSAIQNAAAGTAAASFVASQIGNSIAGTFGMGYAKLVVGQAAWAASVGALGEKMANGNQLTREGSFTRADGSTSAMGEFRLATDTFNTRFAEPVEVPEPLKTLPTMGGAGNVRELQQAAAQSSSLAGVLAQFQNAGTRAEQKALLDQLITAWADTSGMAKSLEERASGKYRIVYEAFGNERRSSHLDAAAFAAVSSGSVGGSGVLMRESRRWRDGTCANDTWGMAA